MSKVAILTTTRYASVKETRFKLAREMMREALEAEYDVVVVDSSPDPKIQQKLAELRPTQLVEVPKLLIFKQQNDGMGAGRRELFGVARDGHDDLTFDIGPFSPMTRESSPGIFLWTEPEKKGTAKLIPQIVKPIEDGKADIVVVCRTLESTATYPRFQQISEEIADRVYMEITGLSGGPMHGPVAFTGAAARYFAECDPKALGFPEIEDTYLQHYAPFFAMRDGLRVVAVPVNFIYPPEQKAEEEGVKALEMVEKRLWQANTLIRAYFILSKRLGLIKGGV